MQPRTRVFLPSLPENMLKKACFLPFFNFLCAKVTLYVQPHEIKVTKTPHFELFRAENAYFSSKSGFFLTLACKKRLSEGERNRLFALDAGELVEYIVYEKHRKTIAHNFVTVSVRCHINFSLPEQRSYTS